jgi:hypothetical protein
MRKTPQWFERLLFHRQTDVNDEGLDASRASVMRPRFRYSLLEKLTGFLNRLPSIESCPARATGAHEVRTADIRPSIRENGEGIGRSFNRAGTQIIKRNIDRFLPITLHDYQPPCLVRSYGQKPQRTLWKALHSHLSSLFIGLDTGQKMTRNCNRNNNSLDVDDFLHLSLFY